MLAFSAFGWLIVPGFADLGFGLGDLNGRLTYGARIEGPHAAPLGAIGGHWGPLGAIGFDLDLHSKKTYTFIKKWFHPENVTQTSPKIPKDFQRIPSNSNDFQRFPEISGDFRINICCN